MKRTLLAGPIIALLSIIAAAAPKEKERPHTPEYGQALQRATLPVEFTLKDAAGEPVILDSQAYAGWADARINQIEGEYSWPVPSWLDKSTGVVTAGTLGVPGASNGDYELEVNLGFYGNLTHKFSIANKALQADLSMPRSRKLVKVRLVDEAGNPIKAVPLPPTFSDNTDRLPPRDAVLPDPVLRLPPKESRGGGGFFHRRARGGGGRGDTFALTDDGYFYVTVFNGGKGTINVPLGEEWFGKKLETLEAPFDKAEYEVRVTPTDAYSEKLVGGVEFRNEDDPGYKRARAAATPTADLFKPKYVHKLTLTPTIRAWARDCEVGDEHGKIIECQYTPAGVEFAERPAGLGVIFLRPRADGEHVGTLISAEHTARDIRANRTIGVRISAWAGKDGKTKGMCFRVLDAKSNPVRFVEATLIPIEEESIASGMRKLEQKLLKDGNRPPAPESLSAEAQNKLREAADDEVEGLVEDAIGKEAFSALKSREYRLRYANYGAWYDSMWRMDGDSDGYVVAPQVQPEKGRYALYIWGQSRDDLNPDFRLLIDVTGETTDLGVVRLPK